MAVDDRLALTGCAVDWQRGVVVPHEGPEVPLTGQELAFLRALAARTGPVGRDALITMVWGPSARVGRRACDTVVARLRAKIEVDPAAPDHLLTVHGEGYRLETLAAAPLPAPARPQALPPLVLGPFRIDLDRYEVDGPRGRTALTGNEASLLRCLAEARGAAVERDTLIAQVWGPVRFAARRLDNAVRRLRAKIEAEPDAPRYLVTAIRGGHRLVVPPIDVPPAPTLPAALDRRFGPHDEVDVLAAQLTPGVHVTLTGPEGIGKSRLALAVGHALEAAGRSVAWVAPGQPLPDPIGDDGVLIVDEAEGIAAPARVSVLATRRTALGFDGERVVAVRPLSHADAVALFLDRAVRAPLPTELPDVEALVVELGGVPGAIERAAARTAVRSVGEVRARLAKAARHNS